MTQVLVKRGSDIRGEEQSNKIRVMLEIEGASILVATFTVAERARTYANTLAEEYKCRMKDETVASAQGTL